MRALQPQISTKLKNMLSLGTGSQIDRPEVDPVDAVDLVDEVDRVGEESIWRTRPRAEPLRKPRVRGTGRTPGC